MKKLLLICGYLLIVMLFVSCCKKQKQQPCKLLVYGSLDKIYQIDFNGKDSLKTLCGTFEINPTKHINKFGYVIKHSQIFSEKNFHLESVYMYSSVKLSRRQSRCLISILKRLNSKVITDTVKGTWKDVWNIYLSLEKQNISLQTYGIKDSDIQMLVDSMIEYSPLFINVYSNTWFGFEKEQELIRRYDKRKNKYSYDVRQRVIERKIMH